MLRVMTLLLMGLFFIYVLPAAAETAIVEGNLKGQMVLTEYVDYECPHCKRMQVVVDTFLKTHPKVKLRIVPEALLNQASIALAATAILIAETHHDFTTFNQMAWALSPHRLPDIKKLWQWFHLTKPAAQKALHSQRMQKTLLDNLQSFEIKGKGGVPLFVFSAPHHSAMMLRGEQSLGALEEAYQHV